MGRDPVALSPQSVVFNADASEAWVTFDGILNPGETDFAGFTVEALGITWTGGKAECSGTTLHLTRTTYESGGSETGRVLYDADLGDLRSAEGLYVDGFLIEE